MTTDFQPNNETFQQIYDAVAETPRGRWFLNELGKRNRVADTAQILLGLEQLRDVFEQQTAEHYLHILRTELEQMSSSIQETRAEIAAIRPDDAANNRIMAATEELDAIVTATERATTDILSSAERLQEIADKLASESDTPSPEIEEITTLATNIFMACSFQDITGQRTTKVVNTMRYLEQRVNAMIELWGTNKDPAKRGTIAKDGRPDAHLLNGPQAEGAGVSQDDIDRMLDSEDIEDVASEIEQAVNAEDSSEPQDDAAEADTEDAAELLGDADDSDEEISQDDIDALFG